MKGHYEAVPCPWLHIYNTHVFKNRMQWLGSRAASWSMPGIAENVKIKGIGHSALLRDPGGFPGVLADVVVPFLKE